MSWSLTKSGKASDIAPVLASEFSKITLTGDEATLRDEAAVLVAKALALQPRAHVIVNCSGSGIPYTASGWAHSIRIEVTAAGQTQ